MRLSIIAIAALVALTACTDRRSAPDGEVFVIRNDGGGQLISAIADRQRFAAFDGRIEIDGKCASACVIFTTLPNVCIRPDAWIGFHGSNIPEAWRLMHEFLRGDAADQYAAEWRKVPQSKIHRITPQEYKLLDPKIKICA